MEHDHGGGEPDYLLNSSGSRGEYENCYGDTAALNVPSRWYAWETLLKDQTLRDKLVHGSDWPIISLPRIKTMGAGKSWEMMGEKNWMRRDVRIKQELGLDEAYWNRAAKVLRRGTGVPPVLAT